MYTGIGADVAVEQPGGAARGGRDAPSSSAVAARSILRAASAISRPGIADRVKGEVSKLHAYNGIL